MKRSVEVSTRRMPVSPVKAMTFAKDERKTTFSAICLRGAEVEEPGLFVGEAAGSGKVEFRCFCSVGHVGVSSVMWGAV